jgi:hypothetical protein
MSQDERLIGARYANVFQQLVVDPGEQLRVNVIGLEGVGILAETDCLEPIPHRAHPASSSSNAFASCSTDEPKPSVNQP